MSKSFLKSRKKKSADDQKDTGTSPVSKIGGHRSAPPVASPSKPVPLPVIGRHRKTTSPASSARSGPAPISEMQKWKGARPTGGPGPEAPTIGRGRGLGVSRGSSAPTPTPTVYSDVEDEKADYNTVGHYTAPTNPHGYSTAEQIRAEFADTDDNKTDYNTVGHHTAPTNPHGYSTAEQIRAEFADTDDNKTDYNTVGHHTAPTNPHGYSTAEQIRAEFADTDDNKTDYNTVGHHTAPTNPHGYSTAEQIRAEFAEDEQYEHEDDEKAPYNNHPGYVTESQIQAQFEEDEQYEDEDDEKVYYNDADVASDSSGQEEKDGPDPQRSAAHPSSDTPAVRTHRAWLIAKLSKNYEYERTIQRQDLKGAAADLARNIKLWYAVLAELRKVPSDDEDALDDALKGVGRAHPIHQMDTVEEAVELAQKAHADLLEKARRQDLPVTEDGVLGDISSRLVEYDDDAGREQSLVLVGSQKLFRNDENKTPVDTKLSSTFHSGLGAEIFVVGTSNDIHMASHKIGKFHHSSLLGGQDVSMGGEMQVTAGKIDWVSNKSGHYSPSVVQFQQFLHHLGKDGVPLTFPVMGWGVPENITAQQLVDGVKANGQADERKGHDYQKTQAMLTAWKSLIGERAMTRVIENEDWSITEWNGEWEVVDEDGLPVPPQEVRRALKAAYPDERPVGER